MLGAIISVAALALTGIAVACKRSVIFLGAAFAWGLLGFWGYINKVTVWDIYFMLFLFCMAMLLVLGFEAFMAYEDERRVELKKMKQEEVIEAKATVKEQMGMHPADKLRMKHGLPVSMVRQRKNNNIRTGW